MEKSDNDNLQVLLEIRDTLNRIYICFEKEYLEIQKQKYEEKIKKFEEMLTDTRKKIFPLLFDQRHFSQVDIAKQVGASKQAVSLFVNLLLENDLIEQHKEAGQVIYRDKYDLTKRL
jgi:predicted transcriptional regulator